MTTEDKCTRALHEGMSTFRGLLVKEVSVLTSYVDSKVRHHVEEQIMLETVVGSMGAWWCFG